MEEIRSFIAIEIPQPLKARLGELQRELRRTEADVRWVRPEGVHLTLKFLGSVSTEVLEKLFLAIAPVVEAWSPFDLRIHGLGCFPSIRNARVLWVGIAQGGAEASSLQKAVEDKSAELGLQPEARPFQPHLTLGRVRSPKGRDLLAEAIESHKDAEVGTFRASEVYLFKSELRPSGAVYTKLQTFPMGESQE
jgi:2'-5' RNA ligase